MKYARIPVGALQRLLTVAATVSWYLADRGMALPEEDSIHAAIFDGTCALGQAHRRD